MMTPPIMTKGLRRASAIGVAVTTVLAIGGCSSGDKLESSEPTPSAAQSSPSPSAQPSTTSGPGAETEDTTNTPDSAAFIDPNRALGNALIRAEGSRTNYVITSFHLPGHGSVNVVDRSLFGEEVSVYDTVYAVGESTESRILAVNTVKSGGGGLTTLFDELRISGYSVDQQEWSSRPATGITAEKIRVQWAAGSSTDVFAVAVESDDVNQVYGINAVTGETVWHISDKRIYPAHNGLLLQECQSIVRVDISTGNQTTLHEYSGPFDSDGCYSHKHPGHYDSTIEFWDGRNPHYSLFNWTVAEPAFSSIYTILSDDGRLIFDLENGKKLNDQVHRMSAYDPIRGHGIVWTDDENLSVLDTESGGTIWSLEASQSQKLNLSVKGLYDELLYLETVNGNVVVNIQTGDDSHTWDVYPVGVVGDWVWWSDNSLTPIEAEIS